MHPDLTGRVAIVTGAASGIGRATALLLARHGARVYSGDLTTGGALAQQFAELGIVELKCDVRDDEQVRALVDRAAREGGGLHIVVSNAGLDLPKGILAVTDAEWDACLDTNLKGGFLLARHTIPHLRDSGGGSIIFTASNAGVLPRSHDPVYSTSKAAVIALANSLALAHSVDRIRVNSVCPGPVSDTRIMEQGLAGQGGDRAAAERRFIEASPLARAHGRMIRPEEVAEAILYLASDAAAMVTGTALRIDGGKSLGVPPRI
jgi:NAD(P)-dependent dehydrogenase (short-subunit alcohol dehydrogenase family)